MSVFKFKKGEIIVHKASNERAVVVEIGFDYCSKGGKYKESYALSFSNNNHEVLGIEDCEIIYRKNIEEKNKKKDEYIDMGAANNYNKL
jgi:hypothetical protein